MRWIVAVIFVFLLQALCLGQSNESLAKELDYHPDFTELRAPQIKLEDCLTRPQSRYTTQFEGLQGVIVSRGLSYMRKYENQALDDYWTGSNMNVCEWDRWLTHYYDGRCDLAYGRWWDRSLFDSRPPEQGGVIYEINRVGKEEYILNWSQFHLTNTGKLHIAQWGFGVERLQLPPPTTVATTPSSVARQRDPPLSIRAAIPAWLLTTEYYRVSTIQNVTLRGSLTPEKILAKVEVGVDIKFYSKYSKDPWAELVIKARTDPFGGTYDVTAVFQLYCF